MGMKKQEPFEPVSGGQTPFFNKLADFYEFD